MIEGAGDFELPEWARDFSPWEYVQFRELIRTSLPEPDLSGFDEGSARSGGRVYDVLELAAGCKGKTYDEWLLIVHRHFHALLSR